MTSPPSAPLYEGDDESIDDRPAKKLHPGVLFPLLAFSVGSLIDGVLRPRASAIAENAAAPWRVAMMNVGMAVNNVNIEVRIIVSNAVECCLREGQDQRWGKLKWNRQRLSDGKFLKR
jgi:hypothetical protein